MKKFPVGIDGFKKLVENDYVFVDKTLFISDLLSSGAEITILTRPRRFGKTLNLSMLHTFFRCDEAKENQPLFEDLKIGQHPEAMAYQGKYPTIFLTLKNIKKPTYDAAYQGFTTMLASLYQQHRFLFESTTLYPEEKEHFHRILTRTADTAEVEQSLLKLSEYLFRHYGEQVVILLDEYDSPLHESYAAEDPYHDKLLRFMRTFLGSAFKGNDALFKGVITGILRISQASLFSDLNNPKICTLLNQDYASAFGFTEPEVDALFAEAELNTSLDDVKDWYNGYQIGDVVLYNPWSIISCLDQRGQLNPYWLQTAGHGLLGKVLRDADPGVKAKLQQLIDGRTIESRIDDRTVFTDLRHNSDALWGLLLFSGYLKVVSTRQEETEFFYGLAIPNKEVAGIYRHLIQNWFFQAMGSNAYDALIDSLVKGNLERFQKYVQTYMKESASYFDFGHKTPEEVYHVFVLGLMVGLRAHYLVQSNREAGDGRLDILLLPREAHYPAYIMELKSVEKTDDVTQAAQEALKQIDTKQYHHALTAHHVHQATKIGIAFSGKTIHVATEPLPL